MSESLQQELNYSLLYVHNTLEKLSELYSGTLLSQLHEEYSEAIAVLNRVSEQSLQDEDVERFGFIRLVLAAVAEYSLNPVQAPAINRLLISQLNCLIDIERRHRTSAVAG
ncbi:hypothetical protein [Sinobacterium caligoides]|nr:hypothetical protein [Sinobacterium caligoides]